MNMCKCGYSLGRYVLSNKKLDKNFFIVDIYCSCDKCCTIYKIKEFYDNCSNCYLYSLIEEL